MSNKTQLQTNNTDLSSLIETLRGKAVGSGSSVETCTVTITSFANNIMSLDYITYENGEYIYNSYSYGKNPLSTITINNAVCGGMIRYVCNYSYIGYTYDENSALICTNLTSTFVPFKDMTFEIYDDD